MTGLQLGGYDPLDAQLDDATVAPSLVRRRGATWSASSVPVASLLLVGIVLGPRGINVLSPGILSLLDPALPVALAALGSLVALGLGTDVRKSADRRRLRAALVQSGLTVLIVAIPLALAQPPALVGNAIPLAMFACALGLCAASSLTVPGDQADEARPSRVRMLELEVLLPIIAGGVLFGVVGRGPALPALMSVGQAVLIAMVLAAAAWLLLSRAASDTEQRIFALSAMLLIGGVADYLSLSALLSGLAAGSLWQLVGGQARDTLRRDAVYLRHSLLVLVLVVAGARIDIQLASFAVAVGYVLVRTAGRLMAGSVARQLTRVGEPHAHRFQTVLPGVFGAALALDTVRTIGSDDRVLLTVVVLGTIGADLMARLFGAPVEESLERDRGEATR